MKVKCFKVKWSKNYVEIMISYLVLKCLNFYIIKIYKFLISGMNLGRLW